MLEKRKKRGINFSIVVVAEGKQLEGKTIERPSLDTSNNEKTSELGGVANVLRGIIEEKTKLETRVSSLGYVQRGGTPVAYDRSLATAFGVKAVELIEDKRYGEMTALKGNRIIAVPLEKVAGGIKTINLKIYKVAELFFG